MNMGPMCWWSRAVQLQREGLCGVEGVSGSCLPRREGMAPGCARPKPRGHLGRREAEVQDKEGPWQGAVVGVQPWDTGSRDSSAPCLAKAGGHLAPAQDRAGVGASRRVTLVKRGLGPGLEPSALGKWVCLCHMGDKSLL